MQWKPLIDCFRMFPFIHCASSFFLVINCLSCLLISCLISIQHHFTIIFAFWSTFTISKNNEQHINIHAFRFTDFFLKLTFFSHQSSYSPCMLIFAKEIRTHVNFLFHSNIILLPCSKWPDRELKHSLQVVALTNTITI